MPVTRMLDRVRDGLEAVFTERSAPDDVIDFDASLEFVAVHGKDEDENDENHTCSSQAVVNLWMSLATPEIKGLTKTSLQLMVPVYRLEFDHEVEEVANEMWDNLAAHRAMASLDLDNLDDEEDES